MTQKTISLYVTKIRLDSFHCLNIFTSHIRFERHYLRKNAVTFETLYMCEVNILRQWRESKCILVMCQEQECVAWFIVLHCQNISE